MKTQHTLIIFTEGNAGMIVRLTTMILRRRIHIEQLLAETLALHGIYRITILVNEESDTVKKLMLQIDKQVEVFRAFYDTDAGSLRAGVRKFLDAFKPDATVNTQSAIPEISA